MDKTYYIKKGRKYIPVGMHSIPTDHLPDGIWIIQSRPGTRSYHPILSFVKHDFDVFHDLSLYAEEVEVKEVLAQVIHEMIENKEFVIYNHSIYEVSAKISKKMFDKIKELKNGI